MGSTAMKSTVNHSTMKAILLALFCLCFLAVSRAEELSGCGNHNNEELNALKLRLAKVEKELQSHTTYNGIANVTLLQYSIKWFHVNNNNDVVTLV